MAGNQHLKHIAPGSVIDLYNTATSKVYEDLYLEIENNKTPHIWSNLEGEKLDDTGIWVNLPRKDGENDNNYKSITDPGAMVSLVN